MAGDEVTGITILQMEVGLDTGQMLLKQAVEIEGKNAAQLTDELAIIGSEMMVEVLADLASFEPIPQPEGGVTYAAKISKEEARIDWSGSAAEIVRHVQGLAPFPGAWFEKDGERLKLLTVHLADGKGDPGEVLDDRLTIACGEGALRPTLIQRAGKAAMTTGELLRGFPIPKGMILK
jgi:methionyl-tRNA formyltransferase